MANRQVDYLPVAIETGSNVEGQSSYAIDPIRLTGHQAGVAKSAVANRMWRQSSMMVAALANLLSEALDVDTLDDGDVEALKAKLQDVLMGGRTTIANGDINFYVSATGSDGAANDGLTQASAWATLQHAYEEILERYDFNGFVCYLKIGSGQNFTQLAVHTALQGATGSHSFIIRGSGMGATRINAVNGNCLGAGNGADFQVSDLALTASGDWPVWTGYGIWCGNSCTVNWDRINFQACSCHLHATQGANLYTIPFIAHSYTISGGARLHMMANLSSMISLYSTTITVTGTPHFSDETLYANSGGYIGWTNDSSSSGAATGMRFWVDRVSRVGVSGRQETVIPGDISGYIAAEVDGNYFDGIRV